MKKIFIAALILMFTAAPLLAGDKEELQLKVNNAKLAMDNIRLQMQVLPTQYEQIQKALTELEAKLKVIEDKEVKKEVKK
jgi:hypothetical protein